MKENSKIKNKNEAVEVEKRDFLEDLQRVQADFENYIKRVEKEKENWKLSSKSELLLKLIRIKEDFEKAVENTKDDGVKMIYGNLSRILDEEGVREIKSLGERFNHELHEVVKKVEGSEDMVIEEIQKGYLIGDKILRIAKVVIGGKNGN